MEKIRQALEFDSEEVDSIDRKIETKSESDTQKTCENQKLCLALVKSETRAEIIKHLKNAGYWDDPTCWRDYGDEEANWSSVGNQQASPDAALVEKLTNSIDAVLMNACKENGDDPEGGPETNTPQNMRDAAQKYFGIKGGGLSDLTGNQRTEFAEKIKLVATGEAAEKSKNPKINYIIADCGEGQTPHAMPDTLLSLMKSNKANVPFVQGNFNMGSTGVFGFDDENLLQLILTKKNPRIADGKDVSANRWGFTIVRRFPEIGKMKKPVLRYLAPGEQILSFAAEELPILPGKYPEAYSEPMHFGTFIKLYEYDLGVKAYNSFIYLNFYYRLSLLLSKPCLPIRLYERREYKKPPRSPEINLTGLKTRLDDNISHNIEEGYPLPISFRPLQGQNITGSLYVFKKGAEMKHYAKRTEGIVFTLNGQCHAKESRVWFKNECGLNYLYDSMLVFIDCSTLSYNSKNKMFKTSRDRLSDTSSLAGEIYNELEDFIKGHSGLKELNTQRRAEQQAEKTGDNKALADTLEKLINKSRSLQNLLGYGNRLANPFDDGSKRTEVLLKKFPDFFELEKSIGRDHPKLFPCNQKKAQVKFKTNAENDYFKRADDPGDIRLVINGEEYNNFSINLWNGTAKLNIGFSEAWQVGDLLEIKTTISDCNRIEPFTNRFYIKIDSEKKKPESSTTSKKSQKGGLSIPEVMEVSKENWKDHGFDRESALKVVSGGEQPDFYVNVDNVHLLDEIKARPKMEPKDLREQYKIGMALFGLTMLSDSKQDSKNAQQDSDENESANQPIDDDMIRRLSKLFSVVLLPTIGLASFYDDI